MGLEARRLDSRACRVLEPGLAPRVVGGVEAPGDHQVSPRALAGALRAAFERAGGQLRSGTRVTAVLTEGGEVSEVALDGGETIAARAVAVAAGARSAELEVPGDGLPVRPVKGQILRLRGPASARVAKRIVRTPEVYAVPRADGRLVVGATVEERGFDATVTAGAVLELLRSAYEVLPGIAELELVETAAGHRPGTPDNLPIVGEGEPGGLVWATGHWRNGVLLAPVTAEAVAALVCGEAPPAELEPFSPARFRKAALATEQRP
jgi:glycine oxidase